MEAFPGAPGGCQAEINCRGHGIEADGCWPAAVWKAIQAKDYDLATKYQRQTNILNSVMCAINNIAAYKVILKNEGVLATTKMHRPFENLTPQQEQDLLSKLAELEYRKVKA